jgi:hypothetical protein
VNTAPDPFYKTYYEEKTSNFQGLELKVATLKSPPYMTKVGYNNETGSFEMEGMFAEMFFALEVSKRYKTF